MKGTVEFAGLRCEGERLCAPKFLQIGAEAALQKGGQMKVRFMAEQIIAMVREQ